MSSEPMPIQIALPEVAMLAAGAAFMVATWRGVVRAPSVQPIEVRPVASVSELMQSRTRVYQPTHR